MTSSQTVDAGQDPPGRRPPRSGARRRRGLVAVLAVLAVLLAAVAGATAVLSARVDRIDVALTDSGAEHGTTWVLVGLDSRAELPSGADAAGFGTPDQVPGSRADVVVVVHQDERGTTALSVPRDVIVMSAGAPSRLALTWLDGPQRTVDALCTLGIPTDHLITVDLAGFSSVVDAAGGLDVDVPEPVRDPPAGLELRTAGHRHVDGATALALVRSRHPEHLVDGRWVTAPVDPDGRASAAGTVLSTLLHTLRSSGLRPWRLLPVAWAGSAAVAMDAGTSLPDLAPLAGAELDQLTVLPVGDPVGDTVVRFRTQATTDAVRAAGLSCGP